jgi:hypothetical protein
MSIHIPKQERNAISLLRESWWLELLREVGVIVIQNKLL